MKETIKKIRVWVTKYALTSGIRDVEVEVCSDIDPDMVTETVPGFVANHYHGKGREWHETRDGAIARADKMRQKKIAALKKQIAKLEAMKFE